MPVGIRTMMAEMAGGADHDVAGERENWVLTMGVVTTCLILSMASFVLRLYARKISVAKMWWDDYWMFLVMVICVAMSVEDYIGLAYGSGKHQGGLDESEVLTFITNLYVYMLCWACGVFSVKVGILLFYWRVFTTRIFRIAAVLVGAFSTSIFLSNLFSFAFQCWPVAHFINTAIPGKCVDQDALYLATAIINVVGDVAVVSLPLPVIWNLNTSRNRKWSLSFLFLLGAFVCVASIFRILAVEETDPTDFTFSNVKLGLWSTVEVEVGFICANLPLIRPVLFKWFPALGGSINSTGASPRYGVNTATSGVNVSRSHHIMLSKSKSGSMDDPDGDTMDLNDILRESAHVGAKNPSGVQTSCYH